MKLAVCRSLQDSKKHSLGTLALGYLSLFPNVKCGLEDGFWSVHVPITLTGEWSWGDG